MTRDGKRNGTPASGNGDGNGAQATPSLEALGIGAPLALLAELAHRCPLQCPYCSNPLKLVERSGELATEEWVRVFSEAAELGMHQVHLSGGEPTARRDLEELVAHCSKVGLYTNLITSGVLLDEARLRRLAECGLEHVQVSFQDTDEATADRIGGFKGGHRKKLEVARLVRKVGLPLTINAVMHRQNLDHVGAFIALARTLDAQRIEIAQVQYYGWALVNRAAFMPSVAQLREATRVVAVERRRLKGILEIDYVVPDYYAKWPKTCMGGWGRRFMNINPDGLVLPCHAAQTITHLRFDSVRARSLAWIWRHSEAFNMYRGTAWMPQPCRGCERREVDWGGCRCQAMALLGDAAATDPACSLSPRHGEVFDLAAAEAAGAPPEFAYRRLGARPVMPPPLSR